jgi:hypothetical protein
MMHATYFNFSNSEFYQQHVVADFIRTVIIYPSDLLVEIMHVFCETGTEILNLVQVKFMFQRVTVSC